MREIVRQRYMRLITAALHIKCDDQLAYRLVIRGSREVMRHMGTPYAH